MKKLTLPDSPGFNLLAGLLCFLLLLLLIVFVSRGTASDISTGLAMKANAALKDRGFDGITAEVEGRNVVLTGETTLDSTRIQAAEAVQRIAGMGDLANRIVVNRSPRQRDLFSNNRANSRPRPPAPVVRPSAQKPVGADNSSIAIPESVLPRPAPIAPKSVAPAPKPPTPETAPPVALKPVVPKPAVPKPTRPEPTRPAPVAPRPAALRPVAPRPVAPEPVLQRPAAPPIPVPPVGVESPEPVVAAAPTPATPVAALVSRLAAAGAAPSPYLLQLEVVGNEVRATGYLPDDAALKNLEQRVTLKQPITLQRANAPAQFEEAAAFAAKAIGRLSRGKVRIADRDIRIEGWADGSVQAFIKDIEPDLPPGYALSVQVNSTGAAEPQVAAANTETDIAIAESFEPMDSQQFIAEALSCQSAVDSIMQDRTIAFQFASDALESRSEGFLNEIASAMNRCPNAYLYVIGHTDSVGTQDRNQRLSQRRANSVRNYLLSQGMFEEFVVAQGRGEKEPIFSNSTESGRAGNRRIEFSVRSEPSI